MLDKRTETEKKMLDLILEVQDIFGIGRKVGRVEFREVMGHIRNMRVILENKSLGCWSGRHLGECTCTPEKQGGSVDHLKYGGKRA